MNIMSLEGLAKSYADKILFADLSLGIDEGDKIGLVGVNGTGKTTLLKIIAGAEQPDQGKIIMNSELQIAYMPQSPDFDYQLTVLEQVYQGNSPVMELFKEYESTQKQLELAPGNRELEKKLALLSQKMDALDGWQLESEAKTVLTKLDLVDFGAQVGTLSGGQRKRLALASALIRPAGLLILDEPTNHLDNDTVTWLEQYLQKRKGALLMVTHDRYFLDRVVNRIIELDQGSLYSYEGNYSSFLEKKLERQEQEAASERKRQNIIRNELAWIKRGAKARTTKQKARIERFEKLLAEGPETNGAKLEISAGSTRLGKKVIELEEVSKSFGDVKLLEGFSYSFQKESRVGIVGPNGVGKSTLLNLIAGKIEPDSGKVDLGQTVKIGFFTQENVALDDDLRVIEYIRAEAEYIPTQDGGRISASQMLERFLFTPSAQWTPIGKLSGGEKRRLYLLKVLMSAPNVLLLDEPTNDLDTETLGILEDYLEDFPGAIITVSHDRYFLDRVVDRILAFKGQGLIKEYVGNYTDYQEKVQEEQPRESTKVLGKSSAQKDYEAKKKVGTPKFSYKEQREYEEIEDVIDRLEKELQELAREIDGAGSNYELLQELVARQEQLEQQLEEKLERWTYLETLAEEIEAAKQVK